MARNADQIALWNETGSAWDRDPDYLDAMMAEVAEAIVAAAAPQPGERVLDIGCGSGATTLALAARVGAAGHVTGVDVSAPLLANARRRAEGLANIDFIEADASSFAFAPGSADLMVSKFGVMFFDDPEGAFSNLHTALKGRGRLAFVCWRAAADNPFAAVPLSVLRRHVQVPPPDPVAPGPFAFADEARIHGILTHAGFGGILTASLDVDMVIGASAAEAAERNLTMGVAARLIGGQDDRTKARFVEDLTAAWGPYVTPRGVVVPARCWIVTARA